MTTPEYTNYCIYLSEKSSQLYYIKQKRKQEVEKIKKLLQEPKEDDFTLVQHEDIPVIKRPDSQ
jgi:L-rhamnose mutarotase